MRVIPNGSLQFTLNGLPYYYYYGTYYAPRDSQYEVVQAPVGAVVESIPDGYEKVEVDGQSYYIINGVQYKPVIRNEEVWYQVIKNKNIAPAPAAPSLKEQNNQGESSGN